MTGHYLTNHNEELLKRGMPSMQRKRAGMDASPSCETIVVLSWEYCGVNNVFDESHDFQSLQRRSRPMSCGRVSRKKPDESAYSKVLGSLLDTFWRITQHTLFPYAQKLKHNYQ